MTGDVRTKNWMKCVSVDRCANICDVMCNVVVKSETDDCRSDGEMMPSKESSVVLQGAYREVLECSGF